MNNRNLQQVIESVLPNFTTIEDLTQSPFFNKNNKEFFEKLGLNIPEDESVEENIETNNSDTNEPVAKQI